MTEESSEFARSASVSSKYQGRESYLYNPRNNGAQQSCPTPIPGWVWKCKNPIQNIHLIYFFYFIYRCLICKKDVFHLWRVSNILEKWHKSNIGLKCLAKATSIFSRHRYPIQEKNTVWLVRNIWVRLARLVTICSFREIVISWLIDLFFSYLMHLCAQNSHVSDLAAPNGVSLCLSALSVSRMWPVTLIWALSSVSDARGE